MARDLALRRFPAQIESDVSQYATDYVELRGTGNLAIDFRGATSTRLASNEPWSGQYAWWANREDNSDARLTRAFDLSGVDTATLSFWTWYDIEDDWDYGYVMASADGGETWTAAAHRGHGGHQPQRQQLRLGADGLLRRSRAAPSRATPATRSGSNRRPT